MNDQERLVFLEAIVVAQDSIIKKYADVLTRLARTESYGIKLEGDTLKDHTLKDHLKDMKC